MEYLVRLSPEAEADLQKIYALVGNAASPVTARSYINRILGFIAGFETFPERGTVRSDIRPGLRMIGFERRITVAFVVEGDEVIILRLLYAGRAGEFD